MDLEEIKRYVKEHLSEKRYFHSLCVMEKCEELAMQYNVDVPAAKKVGLLHDIAKELTDSQKLTYISENNLSIDNVEENNLGLLHGKIGADIAKKIFKFSPEMCDAICFHCTAKENMSMLCKILYVADWTSADRTFENAKIINHELLTSGIDAAILLALNIVIEDQIKDNKLIHVNSINARNYLLGGNK